MGSFVASEIVKKMVQKDIPVKGAKALLLGFTFKENCPDFRNTRVIDIYKDLVEFGLDVTVYDPWINIDDVSRAYSIEVIDNLPKRTLNYSVIVLAVSHHQFLKLDINSLRARKSIVYDIKSFLHQAIVTARL